MLTLRTLALTAAATLTALGATTSSHAATYGGFTFFAGVLRNVATVNQAATGASNATSYLRVQTCAGALQYPVWVVGGLVCQATTPDYQITMTVIAANQTRVRIAATSATCAIRNVRFGTPNSSCFYDLTNPNPGTVGSLTGFNPVATVLTGGAWNATIQFGNAVRIAGTAAQMDLFNIMNVNFSACFDAGDVFEFVVDTDRL